MNLELSGDSFRTMDKELVSIIMPAFNAERFIAKALESVRAQTYKHWELIVTNDGGSDGTPQIVSTFAKSVAQTVVLIQHQHALGPSAARNSGMKIAKGEFIAFLDSDDIWLSEHLESLCEILRSGMGDLAYSDAYVFTEAPSGEIDILPIAAFKVTNPRLDLFRRNFINTSGAALTRRLMERVGEFDQGLWAGEEADYWIRAAIQGFEIVGTLKRTYYYRKSEGSLSSASARMAEGAGTIFEKHRKCGLLPESELVTNASDCYFAAGKLYWRKDSGAARRNFYKSWTLNKLRALPLLWYLLTSMLSVAGRA